MSVDQLQEFPSRYPIPFSDPKVQIAAQELQLCCGLAHVLSNQAYNSHIIQLISVHGAPKSKVSLTKRYKNGMPKQPTISVLGSGPEALDFYYGGRVERPF